MAEDAKIREAKEQFTGRLVQQGWKPSEAERKAREVARKHDQRNSRG